MQEDVGQLQTLSWHNGDPNGFALPYNALAEALEAQP